MDHVRMGRMNLREEFGWVTESKRFQRTSVGRWLDDDTRRYIQTRI